MVAKTSPMGWNSWDCYGAAVTEQIVRDNAKYMQENLLKYGYEYIVVDIQWYEPKAISHEYNNFTELAMDEFSRLIPDEGRFPSSRNGAGFKPLADDIHEMGLKFGIHIMRGIPRQSTFVNSKILNTDLTARQVAKFNSICNWNSDMYGVLEDNTGSQAYYDSIFEMYASWGVDFVKVDDIANFYPRYEIEMIRRAIDKCGREMVLSLSPGPAKIEEAEHLKEHANMWRITDDFWDKWELLYEMFERAHVWSSHVGISSWPDADMLPVGAILQDYDKDNWTKFTKDEQITMMNLWSMLRSPLMIGAELTRNDKFTLDLLTNDRLLKIHKDIRGAHQFSRRYVNDTEVSVWVGSSYDGNKYIAIFNIGESGYDDTVVLENYDVPDVCNVEDVWSGECKTNIRQFRIHLKPHQSKLLIIN